MKKFNAITLQEALKNVLDSCVTRYKQSVDLLKDELDPNASATSAIKHNIFSVVTLEHTVTVLSRFSSIINRKSFQDNFSAAGMSISELINLVVSKEPYMLLEYTMKSRSSRSTCEIENLVNALKGDIERQLFLGDSLRSFSSILRHAAEEVLKKANTEE